MLVGTGLAAAKPWSFNPTKQIRDCTKRGKRAHRGALMDRRDFLPTIGGPR